jgi:hypothetical protein
MNIFCVYFHVEEHTWDAMYQPNTPLPGKRYEHSAVVYNKAMWVTGGLEVFTPRNDVWTWEFGEFCTDFIIITETLGGKLKHH